MIQTHRMTTFFFSGLVTPRLHFNLSCPYGMYVISCDNIYIGIYSGLRLSQSRRDCRNVFEISDRAKFEFEENVTTML